MPKDIRFGELVKRSGRPQVITLWTDPKQDRSFMKAVKENRVLTLIQKPAGKRKDFGRIGFHQEPHASYLVFPKPLPEDSEPRVIGIKYDLLEESKVRDAVKLSDEEPKRPAVAKEPRRKSFQVILRRTAVLETSITVGAVVTANEAKRKAIKSAAGEPFDVSKAVFRNEVLSLEPLGSHRERIAKSGSSRKLHGR